jgi:capsular polysaccharide export protein
MLCSPFCFYRAIMTARFASLSSPPIVYSVRFWNRKAVGAIITAAYGYPPLFVNDFSRALSLAQLNHAPLIGWSSRVTAEQAKRIQSHVEFYRIEDGFVRSVGLGAGLNGGASFVVDGTGIYYDASQPSDLEVLLQEQSLTPMEVARGEQLITALVSQNISKYNLKGSDKGLPDSAGKEAILVVGQVADDASVRSSLSQVLDCESSENINKDLLAHTRSVYPDACIVYKPHPDVVSGLRAGMLPESEVLNYADACLPQVDIMVAIDWCDRLETVSSLSGFEALLRGKQVTTYGSPFYAGWGLTQDHADLPRRGRERSLAELVYLALVEYSHYYHPHTQQVCTPEALIDYLAQQKKSIWVAVKTRVLTAVSWLGTQLGL